MSVASAQHDGVSPAASGAGGLTARVGFAIVVFGLIALTLLSLRQQRLQALHELSAVRLRQSTHDRELWELRAALSSVLTPEQVGVLPSGGGAALGPTGLGSGLGAMPGEGER
ncbi:MAG: hypothetical protein AAGF47_11100 [Planctomycetota bacterium]